MGLLDVFNGMQNGPRGFRAGGGGMSPITMGILGLLAYKAVKSLRANAAPANAGAKPSNASTGNGSTGGLGDWLNGRLGAGAGGAAAGGGLGGLLSGGLGDLLKQFQGAGQGQVANSWIDTRPNNPIAPAELGKVLTPEQMEFLQTHTGLSRDELLDGLSQQLPHVVDRLTPAGRLPTPDEMNRVVA